MNFKKINDEYTKQLSNVNNQIYLNENDDIVHSMKVKGKLYKDIPIDKDFEKVDLLDYFEFERKISCKKDNK